jgi:FixJ family two-component response regulator
VRPYTNAGDFLLANVEEGPGCILLDFCLPGPSGLDLQKALASRSNTLPIIFLTGYGDIPTSVRAIKAGAVDFLTKPVERGALLKAISNALAQDAASQFMREQLKTWRSYYASLTKRELEVLDGVVAGKLNKQIASEIGAAERTVKAHRAHVMQKMCAGSVAELVHIADQLERGGEVRSGPWLGRYHQIREILP